MSTCSQGECASQLIRAQGQKSSLYWEIIASHFNFLKDTPLQSSIIFYITVGALLAFFLHPNLIGRPRRTADKFAGDRQRENVTALVYLDRHNWGSIGSQGETTSGVGGLEGGGGGISEVHQRCLSQIDPDKLEKAGSHFPQKRRNPTASLAASVRNVCERFPGRPRHPTSNTIRSATQERGKKIK